MKKYSAVLSIVCIVSLLPGAVFAQPPRKTERVSKRRAPDTEVQRLAEEEAAEGRLAIKRRCDRVRDLESAALGRGLCAGAITLGVVAFAAAAPVAAGCAFVATLCGLGMTASFGTGVPFTEQSLGQLFKEAATYQETWSSTELPPALRAYMDRVEHFNVSDLLRVLNDKNVQDFVYESLAHPTPEFTAEIFYSPKGYQYLNENFFNQSLRWRSGSAD